jgi:hypothetical protein
VLGSLCPINNRHQVTRRTGVVDGPGSRGSISVMGASAVRDRQHRSIQVQPEFPLRSAHLASTVTFFSVPVNVNGGAYVSDIGVPQSSPTSKVSSVEE